MTANLFLVGAPRAGTTSLFDYLSRHPAIFAPAEKEPHRYDQDVLDGRPAMRGDDYRALYAGATNERWRLDGSALYLYSAQALEAVARTEGAEAVIVLRDPVELLASWHGLLVATGSEPHTSLAEALEDRSPDLPFERRYLEIARFASPVERWLERMGAGHVHVLLFEDLTGQRSAAVCEGLLASLGLDAGELGPFPHLNTHRRPAPVRLTGSPALRRVARVALPGSVRRRIWWTANAAMTPHAERPPVPAGLRARLQSELDSDVRRLGALLGLDLRDRWFGQQPRS